MHLKYMILKTFAHSEMLFLLRLWTRVVQFHQYIIHNNPFREMKRNLKNSSTNLERLERYIILYDSFSFL